MAQPFAPPFGFMPPTLTGQENDPNRQLMEAILAAGRGMNFSQPANVAGPPPGPYQMAPQSVFGPGEQTPMAQGTAMPQQPTEREDLQQQMAGSGAMAQLIAPFALGPVAGPALRTAGAAIRSNPIPALSALLGFGAVPAATRSEPQPPSQLRIDPADLAIGGARAEVDRITKRQNELRDNLATLQITAQRFSPEKLSGAKPEEIKEIQTILKRLNLYQGPIDGNWGRGTASAVERRLAQITSEQERANKELEGLSGPYATEDRRLKGLQRQQQRDRTEHDMPWWDRIIRDYGTPLGMIGGTPFGAGARWGTTKAVNATRQVQADRANELISRNYGNVSDRVGGLNRFYQEGGGNPPLRLSSTARGGFTETNRGRNAVPQTPATDLYPSRGPVAPYVNPTTDIPAVGALIAAGGLGQVQLWKAEEELARAKADADTHPGSAEHADNLARAEARLNYTRLVARMTQGAPLGYVASGTRLHYSDVRPNVDRAAGELRRLSEWRRRQ